MVLGLKYQFFYPESKAASGPAGKSFMGRDATRLRKHNSRGQPQDSKVKYQNLHDRFWETTTKVLIVQNENQFIWSLGWDIDIDLNISRNWFANTL